MGKGDGKREWSMLGNGSQTLASIRITCSCRLLGALVELNIYIFGVLALRITYCAGSRGGFDWGG